MDKDLMIKIKAYSDKKGIKGPDMAEVENPAEETLESHMEMMKAMPRYNPIEIMKYLIEEMSPEEEIEEEAPMGDLGQMMM